MTEAKKSKAIMKIILTFYPKNKMGFPNRILVEGCQDLLSTKSPKIKMKNTYRQIMSVNVLSFDQLYIQLIL